MPSISGSIRLPIISSLWFERVYIWDFLLLSIVILISRDGNRWVRRPVCRPVFGLPNSKFWIRKIEISFIIQIFECNGPRIDPWPVHTHLDLKSLGYAWCMLIVFIRSFIFEILTWTMKAGYWIPKDAKMSFLHWTDLIGLFKYEMAFSFFSHLS